MNNQNETKVNPGEVVQGGFTYANNAVVENDFLYLRDADGNQIAGRKVEVGDKITVLDVGYDKQLALLQYPTVGGVRQGYVTNVTKIINYLNSYNWNNGSTTEDVYLESTGENILGSINPYEAATLLYKKGDRYHIVYDTDKGALTKSGYVNFKGANFVEEEEYYREGEVKEGTEYVNIRKEPGITSEILGTKISQEKLEISRKVRPVGDQYYWYRISYKGGYGYIREDFVKINSAVVIPGEEEFYRIGEIKAGTEYVNIRRKPSINDEILGTMTSQEKLEISRKIKPEGDSYYWYRISFKDGYGYIREDFVIISSNIIQEENFSRAGEVKIGTEYVNIRKAPNTSAEILGTMISQEKLDISKRIKPEGDSYYWYKISFKNNYGYIREDFVTIISNAIPGEEDFVKTAEVKFGTEYVNIRRKPSTDTEILGTMTSQEKVKISKRVKPEGDSYYWYKISFKNDYGYIREDFVVIDSDIIPGEEVYYKTGNVKEGTEYVNIRKSPSVNAEILGTMTSLQLLDISKRVKPEGDSYYWYKILYIGNYGYIREDFVIIDNDELINTGNIKRVFIDPGHGGEDSGAVGHVVERDIVLSISEKLGEILRLKGIAVQYSRTSNSTAVELSERSKMANSWEADIFLSIHCNSANSPASGTETFVYTSPSEASKNLANKIVNSISSELSLNNRGMKYANFVVLRESAMPAVLIETAFVNHSSDANKLLYDQQKFANAIANVILGFSVGGNNGSIGGNENTGDNYDTNAEYHRMIKIATPFMKGDDVKKVQTKLNSLGYSVGTVDGVFGYVTEEKVKNFQRAKELEVDGRVGKITWDALMNASLPGGNDTEESYDTNANYHRMLRIATPFMQGADVKQIQTKLNSLGYSVGTVDGIFGYVTEEKVRSFQRAKGLDVDGRVGRITWDTLMNTSSSGSNNGAYDSNANYHRVLRYTTPSMQGADIKQVQTKLNNLGYSVGAVDGVFGQVTEEKVKIFQKAKWLDVDGVVGRVTWDALMNTSSGGSDNGVYDSNANYHRVLQIATPSMKGADVKKVQTKLNNLGYSVGSVDGTFGQITAEKVKSFQNAKGLGVDGKVGSITWNALMNSSSSGGSNSGAYDTNANYHRILKLTNPLMAGEDVKKIQKKLMQLDYNILIDGIFGETSKDRIKLFQKNTNSTIDGIVGAVTWNSLFREYKDVTQALKNLMVKYQYMYGPQWNNGAPVWNGSVQQLAYFYKFYLLVRNGGQADLKNKGWNDKYYYFDSDFIRGDAPGNILYGYLGKAFGYSDELLLRAAGYAQHQAGTSKPEWGHYLKGQPYGDDPMDQRAIKTGINYFKKMTK